MAETMQRASHEAIPVTKDAGRATLNALLGWGTLCTATLALSAYELTHLTGYSFGQSWYSIDDYDEGVYMETGILMAHGYHLYSQIYSAQPPLLTLALDLMDRAVGSGVAQSRLAILVFAVILIAAVALLSYQLAGWTAAGLSVVLLVISPEFLVYAHSVEEEVPVMALGTLALALAVLWRRKPAWTWSASSGLLFGLAVLTKFFAFALLLPLLVILVIAFLDRKGTGRSGAAILRDALAFAVASLLPIAVSFLVWGSDEWNQMVGDRITASTAQAALQGPSNLHMLRLFLLTDPGLMALAAIGGVIVLIADWREGLILDSWGLATLAVLMKYHPLFGHHLIILLAPATALGGIGIACVYQAIGRHRQEGAMARNLFNDRENLRRSTPILRRTVTFRGCGILAGIGLLAYLVLLPRTVSSYSGLLLPQANYRSICSASNAANPNCMTMAKDKVLQQAASTVQTYTPSQASIAVGDPWICVDAKRLCVPDLVDTSYVRIETGKLTPAQAIRATKASHTEALVLSRGLCTFVVGQSTYMSRYVEWATHAAYRLTARLPLAGYPGSCPTAGVYVSTTADR